MLALPLLPLSLPLLPLSPSLFLPPVLPPPPPPLPAPAPRSGGGGIGRPTTYTNGTLLGSGETPQRPLSQNGKGKRKRRVV
jgi:hypothetical protein